MAQLRDGSTAWIHAARALGLSLVLLSGCGGAGSGAGSGTGGSDGGGEGGSPLADFGADPRAGLAPLTVQFADLSSGAITARTWDFGDGSSSNETDPLHVYANPGSYAVALTVSGPGGGDSVLRAGYVQVSATFVPETVSVFGADTPGGSGGAVLHVTNLANDGPGSLRAAIATAGRRTVVFDVAGVIDLDLRTLRVEEPFLTIEGHSGPAPGITLVRGGMNIRTHDVVVRHLKVRPGDAGQTPGGGWEPDGISVWSVSSGNVLIENCSVSWAVDENISVSSSDPPNDSPRGVTWRDCIVSEALQHATHVEVNHSRGALIRGLEVAVERCLFAHDARRNPVYRDGATGIVVNNLIYDPGSIAIHMDTGRASIVGNVMIHGPSTDSDVLMVEDRGDVFLLDNHFFDRSGNYSEEVEGSLTILTSPPFWRDASYLPMPSSQVEAWVLANAGAWPEARDPIDQRIIHEVMTRTGRIIDSQDDVGGYPH